jgi:predicted ATPase/class 3 adenylate cyclase
MTCPACHYANEGDARFCEQCGQPLETACPACGAQAGADARFCRLCGQNLSQPPASATFPPVSATPPGHQPSLDDRLTQLQRYLPSHLTEKILANRGRLEGERKLVTVLFADIAGYSTLSAQLGEEAIFALMDELYESFIHEVHRYEGTVNELTGDGIVAFFGAPLAVEQAPQRAVRAALALQSAAARFGDRLQQERGLRFQLRVGLNTGPVIVGSVGNNLRMDYKAVGHTVNLAARMEQTAAPDTIRVTEHTFRLVEGYFDCEDLGSIAPKGMATRVRAYRVLGEYGTRARIDVARERGFTRLVGRQRELDLLRHGFEQARDGRGQAVSIIGDAGLGKSRLLHECRQLLKDEDLTWLDGRCHPYGVALAYWPMVDVLKQHFQIGVNDGDEDIKRRVHGGLAALNLEPQANAPYLLHLLATGVDAGLPAGLSPEAIKYRTFEALRGVVLALAAHRPLVLAFEDLHWADHTTVELLTFLLDHLAGAPVLLVCTYRPDFATTWSRKSYHHVISLTRLEPQDSRQMLIALLGTPHIQDDLVHLVLDRAEGVPFFLEELVNSLRETGAIERYEGRWRLTVGEAAVQVPDTVDEMLMARIDRLPEGAKGVLQLGAVLGREFSSELLREISGLADWELSAHLAALTEAELLYARGLAPQTTYIFKHAFTQEAAYRSLLTARRRELHHRVAVTLEALFPDRLEEHYGQLAHHFVESAQGEALVKAVEYAVKAGERNMALPAYAEAVRFYQMALDALERLEHVDEAQRRTLLLALGQAQRKAGEHVQALATLQRAADSAREQDALEDLALVALEFELAAWAGKLPTESAVRLLEEVLSGLDEANQTLLARVLGSLARALLFTGAVEQAATCAQRAVETAQRVDDTSVLAFNLHILLVFPWRPEETEKQLAYATEMLQLAEAANDEALIANAHGWRAMFLTEMGNIEAVDLEIEAYTQSAEKLQEPTYFYHLTAFRTMRALLDGRFDDAERLALQMLTLGQRIQVESLEGTFGLFMFSLRREQGRLNEVEPALKLFMKQHGADAAWRPGLALIYSELGREREARRAFEHLAQHDFADLPRDGLWGGASPISPKSAPISAMHPVPPPCITCCCPMPDAPSSLAGRSPATVLRRAISACSLPPWHTGRRPSSTSKTLWP